MRKYSHIVLSTFWAISIVLGCNNTSVRQPLSNTQKDTLSMNYTNDVKNGAALDIDLFKKLTDTLLGSLTGKKIELKHTIDSSSTLSGTKIRYDFDPGKGNKILRLYIKINTYNDKVALEEDFKDLQQNAYGNDMTPGLTYANDYIIKTEDKIIWLNTGCFYGYQNHEKVKANLLKALKTEHFMDSIICKCGQSKCSN